MGQIREVDAISDAIIETEREIAGEAWGNEETERLDSTGDRALESMGEGLEGQQEADDGDAETDGEEPEGDAEDGDGEGEEGEGDGDAAAVTGKTEVKPETQAEKPEGRVPSGKLREEAERRRVVEAERDALKAQIESGQVESRKELEALKTQVATLTQMLGGQRQQPQKTEEPPKPAEAPDIFENPNGFKDYLVNEVKQAVGAVRTDLRNQAVNTSFRIAHVEHKDSFERAFEAINKLNPQNPDDRVVVQRIYNSPDPGEALVNWHRRNETLARVGNDPAAYEERIRNETREALLKDPEFRKQLIADLRGEAATGSNGAPRTETRLPKSLARSGGSNLGAERGDPHQYDDSDQAVADAAWR